MSNKTISNVFEFFTYKDKWEEAKTKLKLTDDQLRDKLEQELQLWAWSDAITDIIGREK
jgi:hypothetical protein